MDTNVWGPYIILFTGFIISYVLYTAYEFRVSGVIAAPLLAIYALEELWLIPILGAIAVALFTISVFLHKRLIYGRKLFLILCACSVVIASPIIIFVQLTAVAFTSVIPAIFAYNYATTEQNHALGTCVLLVEIGLLMGLGFGLQMLGGV
jgi:hypothetical protein